MPEIDDQHYLKTQQYHNAAKLNDRIQLHARFSANKYDWQRWVFDQLEIAPLSRLGCDPGRFLARNARRGPAKPRGAGATIRVRAGRRSSAAI